MYASLCKRGIRLFAGPIIIDDLAQNTSGYCDTCYLCVVRPSVRSSVVLYVFILTYSYFVKAAG